jgi:hypothetical protein
VPRKPSAAGILRPGAWNLPAVVLLAWVAAACTAPPPLSRNAVAFRDAVRSDFSLIEENLVGALAGDAPGLRVDRAIRQAFGALAERGRRGTGLAVLDGEMNYVAGRVMGDADPEGKPLETALTDFSYLKSAFKGIESGQMVGTPLYYPKRKILAICKPLTAGGIRGTVCLFYDAAGFSKTWGIGEEEFTRIDFNSR